MLKMAEADRPTALWKYRLRDTARTQVRGYRGAGPLSHSLNTKKHVRHGKVDWDILNQLAMTLRYRIELTLLLLLKLLSLVLVLLKLLLTLLLMLLSPRNLTALTFSAIALGAII